MEWSQILNTYSVDLDKECQRYNESQTDFIVFHFEFPMTSYFRDDFVTDVFSSTTQKENNIFEFPWKSDKQVVLIPKY